MGWHTGSTTGGSVCADAGAASSNATTANLFMSSPDAVLTSTLHHVTVLPYRLFRNHDDSRHEHAEVAIKHAFASARRQSMHVRRDWSERMARKPCEPAKR